MGTTVTSRYDVTEHLRTPEDMAAYREACLEEANGDAACIAKALGDIARATGMAQVARDAGLSRERLQLTPTARLPLQTRHHRHRHQAMLGGFVMDAHPHYLTADSTLAEIVRRLVTAYQPEQIYLFGSKARGNAGPDSDYDLLVVVPDSAPPERKRSTLAYKVLWGTRAAADVLVCSRSYFDTRVHLKASLPGTVLREGRLLHAA